MTALQKDAVVNLVGPPGLGKRSGAVALLRAVAGGSEYVVLSPSRTLTELVGFPFEPGLGYVLLNRRGDQLATQTADFDWRRLRDHVRERGAHLVVTTVHGAPGKPSEAVRHVPWQAPDLRDALRLRLRVQRCADTVVEEALVLLPEGCTVAEVGAAAARIAEGIAPVEVWQEYGSTAAEPVRKWFGPGDRTLREIAEVTTLAFAIGTGRRTFESLQERLEPRLTAAFPTPVAPAPAADEAPQPPPDRPVDRRRSLRENPLVATEERENGSLSRTIMTFPRPLYRQWVLEELWANYSTAYWDGVRGWLTDLTAEGPGTELSMSIASGLALLARPAFDEVADCYLHPWSRGEAGSEGQYMATHVLWWMCLDEALGAAALALARGWAQSRDVEQRATALLAFSGRLGVRYPTEAVRWIWHTASQGGATAEEAVASMAYLFAVLTEHRADASPVLDALGYRLRKQRRSAVATWVKAVTFDMVGAVVSVRDLRTGQSAVAVLLERQPQLTDRIAELWAGLLCNRPRRELALRALNDTLRALTGACEEPRVVAERLGRELGKALIPDERPRLCPPLRAAATRSGPATVELTEILLDAVLSTRTKD